MKRQTKLKWMMLGFSSLLVLALLEMATRLMTARTDDGNLWFHGLMLRPYVVPVEQARRQLKRYESETNSIIVHDLDIGWVPRPGHDPFNAQGIWSDGRVFPTHPAPDVLRVAVFGGSYALGWAFETSWSHVLEKRLQSGGLKAEVLNFGVSGYSMDQALLRWRKTGRQFKPDMVIMGLNVGYCRDNLNMIRPFQHPGTEIFFPKPRFLLAEGGALQLINAPTVSPSEVPQWLENIQDWPLLSHEAFYDAADYWPRPLHRSRLLGVVDSRLRRDPVAHMDTTDFYAPDGTGGALGLAILRQFKKEVEEAGGAFLVVDLPSEFQLRQFADGRLPYGAFLETLSQEMPVIRLEEAFLELAGGKDLSGFFKGNHYTEAFEHLVAVQLAEGVKASRQP